MKKSIFICVLVVILGILSGYFYTTLSPHSGYESEELNIQVENSNSINTTNINTNNISELFSQNYEKAEEILSTMTLEEKVGQMFLARYPSSGVINEIEKYNPSGYILFARDFKNKNPDSIREEIKSCQDASKIKLALGVDEEGGTVVRVSSYKSFRSTPFRSPRVIYSDGGMEAIIEDSHEKNNLLKSLGLNMNLAPVVDVPESSNDFIYERSFSTNVNEVKEYTREIINTMNSDNLTSVMKHFPGYGNNVDTHTGIAIDKRDYSNFQNRDFIPFKEGINNGAPAILVSHNIVECMDPSKPASLSKNVHNVLRGELGFSGIIMTDDLAMDAVKEYVKNGEAATQAVLAGNDLIISSDFVNQRNEVLDSVRNGTISENIINTAVKRVLAWKLQYEII